MSSYYLRKAGLAVVLLMIGTALNAQHVASLSIEECYQLAAKNSPLYQQKILTLFAGDAAEKNINLKWLPQLDINGQASYQSAVTSLPIKLPNLTIEDLDKDQYRGTMELVQPVFDGGVIATQRKLQHVTTQADAQKVEVDLHQLKTVINAWYFTALLMDQNIQLMDLVKNDLNNSIKTVTAQVANGVATKSNEDLLNAEILKTDQQIIEFKAARKQAMRTLALFTRAAIDESTVLVTPAGIDQNRDASNTRPELKLFDFQQQAIRMQSKLIGARTNPKFSFFADGGYGKPGLNQLKNEFDWFYITGVKMNIPLMGRFTQKRDRGVLKIQESIVASQKENFLINNEQALLKQQTEVDKYKELVATDSAIIALRTRIKENALVKLSNGIVTTTDYIREVNAESQARQGQKLHELSLLQAQYDYTILKGQ